VNCTNPNGGNKIDSGLDTGNGSGGLPDGTLQASEVTATSYVCNGADGADGGTPVLNLTTIANPEVEPETVSVDGFKKASCPANSAAISGGFFVSNNVLVVSSRPFSSTEWRIDYHILDTEDGTVQVYVKCLSGVTPQ